MQISRGEGVGEHQFEIFRLSGSTDDAQIHFVSSNILRLQIADPTLIQRRWGRMKGIAADFTLDKDTYRLGEDVPLHLAIEDFSADVPLYTWDPIWDPRMGGIKVQDAARHPLPANERFPNSSICMGVLLHGSRVRAETFPEGQSCSIGTNIKSGRLAAKSPWYVYHPSHVVSVFRMEERNSDRMAR